MKVIITTGGTGGHIYPALAVAHQLKAQDPSTEIHFVGAIGRMEAEKVPQAGYAISCLDIAGFQRKFTLKNLLVPFKLWRAIGKAQKIIKHFKADVVIGFGGYASGPTVLAAAKLNVPIVVQEQNSFAGLTNRHAAKRAQKVCVAYPNMEQFFQKEKIVFTGNPVRAQIAQITPKDPAAYAHFGLDANKQTLLVMGGSLGARTINESLLAGYEQILAQGYQLLWQTGKYYFEEMRSKVKAQQGLVLTAFLENMDYAYSIADAVISRAGALSVSELCLVGKPVIFVPSPNVAQDHQTHNAQVLVKANAAWLVADQQAPTTLTEKALELLSQDHTRQVLSKNISALARPKATEAIVEVIKNIVNQQ